jgi:lipid-A-disaccharide synthase
MGVPVIFFVSPQLWAWKKHRIRLVQQFVDRMLVIFPFEEPFYRNQGVQAEFVGHPLAELPLPTITRERFAADNGLDPSKLWIGLLPGSRPQEISDHLPEILKAAGILAQSRPDLQFVLPLAPTLDSRQRAAVAQLAQNLAAGITLKLLTDSRASLFHARASVVASGTATVEAALIGNPFVVVYRVSPFTYAIAKRVVKVPHVAMANLIAGKRVVPEILQHDFTASNIVQHLEPLLPDGPARQSMMKELEMVREALVKQPGVSRESAIERVAAITMEQFESVTRVKAINDEHRAPK